MQTANEALLGPAFFSSTQRCLKGLLRTDLVGDLGGSRPHTLIAPVDAGFAGLPWDFEQLLSDDSLLEPCFDLFEYLVIRGSHDADAPMRLCATLQGESILIGSGMVLGHHGVASVVATTVWRGTVVHVVDRCVLPSTILRFEPQPWCS